MEPHTKQSVSETNVLARRPDINYLRARYYILATTTTTTKKNSTEICAEQALNLHVKFYGPIKPE